MSVLLQTQINCSLLQFGQSPAFFLVLVNSTCNFYTGQWEEYHSGVMTTNFGGLIGVIEVQFSCQLLILINEFSGYPLTTTLKDTFPPSLLSSLHIDETFTLRHIALSIMTFCSLVTTIVHIHGAVKSSKEVLFALSGLMPVFLWLMVIVCVFDTDYAYGH